MLLQKLGWSSDILFQIGTYTWILDFKIWVEAMLFEAIYWFEVNLELKI